MAIFSWLYRKFASNSRENEKGTDENKFNPKEHEKHHEELIDTISQGFLMHKNRFDEVHRRLSELERRPPHIIKEKVVQPQYIESLDSEKIEQLAGFIDSEIKNIHSRINSIEEKSKNNRSVEEISSLAKELHHIYEKIDKIESKVNLINPEHKTMLLEKEISGIKTEFEELSKSVSKTIDKKTDVSEIKKIVETHINKSSSTPLNKDDNTFAADILTDAEKKTLQIIIALSGESKISRAANENIIKEMYPHHKIKERRSTIANYVRKLEKLGFAAREKKGRKMFVYATEKGHELQDNLKGKKQDKKKELKKEA